MTIQTKQCNRVNYGGTRAATRYIVVHYTSNRGDTAKNNVDYFARENVGASAHFFVDEKETWSSVPEACVAWHCGAKSYRHPECRNSNALGVEICMNDKQGKVRQASIDRAALLVRALMAKYDIPVERVLRHYDVTGKHCPSYMVNAQKWAEFKRRLEDKMDIDALTDDDLLRLADRMQTALSRRPVSETLAPELAEAVAAGITDGSSPNAFCTRVQAAVMVARATRKD